MALFATRGKTVGSHLATFSQSNNTFRGIKMFKGIKSIKIYNDIFQTRKFAGSRVKTGNRQISQLYQSRPISLEKLCIQLKPVTAMLSQYDECRLNGGYIAPITRHPGYPGIAMKKIHPMISQWRLYAQAKEPDSPPTPGKGGAVTTSGGGLGRLDAVNERGFFHKVNKSRLEQLKQMLKDKSLMKKNEEAKKKEPK